MALKITYFTHGSTIDNEKDIASGWNDVELSKLGVKQLLKMKQQIKEEKFEVVFSSDLKRAFDSAKIVFGEVVPDRRLRECNFGEYNGKSLQTLDSLLDKYIFDCFPSGESFEKVKLRMFDFIKSIKDYKNIAIVSHRVPQLSLEVLLKKKSWLEAIAEDWRKKKAWQTKWEYIYEKTSKCTGIIFDTDERKKDITFKTF